MPWFGIRPKDDITPRWGARAIYSLRDGKAYIDLLWDRQQMEGGTDEARKKLAAWVNDRALPWLKKACSASYIAVDCNEVVTYDRDGYHLEAYPRESYGYLYIGAWPLKEEA